MKTLRFLQMALIAVLMCVNFVSCSNENKNIPVISDEFIDVPLRIKTNFSIDITDEPISRSTEQPVYAIEVSEINPNTSLLEPYAFGFFESTDNLSITLKKSSKYVVSVALYYNYFDNYRFGSYNYEKDVYNETYTNKFISVADSWSHGVTTWYDYLREDFYVLSLINGDCFLGIQEEFSPSQTNTCTIELKRIATAVEIAVEGLEEGIVKFNLGSALSFPYQLTTEKPNLSQMFICKDLINKETAEINFNVIYISPNEKETNLISDSYVFTRNMKKRFLIKLKKEESEDTSTGFKLSLSNTEIENEEQITHICVID